MGDKPNCWEFNKCGREPGGERDDEEEVCPIPCDYRFNGVNGGKGAGRFCWTEPDTKRRGKHTGQSHSCFSCPFFKSVLEEEGKSITMSRAAFIGNHDQSSDSTGECEYRETCTFFQTYQQSTEAEKTSWIKLFCRHQASSQYCERKIILERTGERPPDNMTPTGRLLDSTSSQL